MHFTGMRVQSPINVVSRNIQKKIQINNKTEKMTFCDAAKKRSKLQKC